MVKLTDLSIPEFKVVAQPEVATSSKAALTVLLGEEDIMKIQEVIDGNNTNVVVAGDWNKEIRTSIHRGLREWSGNLRSETDSSGSIVVQLAAKGGNRKRERRLPDEKCYTLFTLHKENRETSDCLYELSKYLHVDTSRFGFAGTKDKRGVTVQDITAFRLSPSKISSATVRMRAVQAGNFRECPTELRLGDLQGNRFDIVLRNVTASDSVITDACDSLFQQGFLNYFGLQRFGTGATSTAEMGKYYLQGRQEWMIASLLQKQYLSLQQRENEVVPMSQELCDEICTFLCRSDGSAQRLMEHLPKVGYHNEFMMLRHLTRVSPNFGKSWAHEAVEQIPRQIRLLYLHAYQSYLWNKSVSARWMQTEQEPKVIPGDLVMENPADISQGQPVLLETLEQCARYKPSQVVLPLPGNKIRYPSHAGTDKLKSLLDADGFVLDSFPSPESGVKIKLSGDYRPMLVVPEHGQWQQCHYEQAEDPLSLTDTDQLSGVELPSPQGQMTAVKLSFTLPSAAYATMALREITRTSTSVEHQKKMNTTEG